MEQPAPQPVVISLDINDETIAGALVGRDGSIYQYDAVAMPVAEGRDAVFDTILVFSRRLIQFAGSQPPVGIGISTLGLVHHTTGIVLQADSRLMLLQDVSLAGLLQETIGLPTRVENVVNAMATAEAYFGAGRDLESFFYIYADTVLDGALFQNGQIWRGTNSSAGQIGSLVAGWMAERPVSLSQRASGEGLAAEYSMRSRKFRTPTLLDIIQYAEHGDQLAMRVIRDGARLLAMVLHPVLNLIDPEAVIVSGALVDIGALWWKTFQETLQTAVSPVLAQVEVMPATLHENAALIGAAVLAHHLDRTA